MQTSTVIMHPEKNRTHVEVMGPKGMLLVRSQFFTLQGEGIFAGRPAYFVRLAGCNLGSKQAFCQGCDTDFRVSESKFLPFEEIFEAAREKTSSPFYPYDFRLARPILVITGGEPSIHDELPDFCAAARESGVFSEIQIESNGFDLEILARAQDENAYVVVSPKASSKGYVQTALVPKVINGRAWLLPASATGAAEESALKCQRSQMCFKYVVSADPKNAHHELPAWVTAGNRPPNFDVYVSPCTVYLRSYEGEVSSAWDPHIVDQEATKANYAYAAQLALKYNLLLSIQMHTLTAIP